MRMEIQRQLVGTMAFKPRAVCRYIREGLYEWLGQNATVRIQGVTGCIGRFDIRGSVGAEAGDCTRSKGKGGKILIPLSSSQSIVRRTARFVHSGISRYVARRRIRTNRQ